MWYDNQDVETHAPVAQGIEQWFPVPRVGGSNPSRCVKTNEQEAELLWTISESGSQII